MDKLRKNAIPVFIAALVVLIVVLLFFNSVRRSDRITLPEMDSPSLEQGDDESGNAVNWITVTPKTVQKAIATLVRPESYSRSVTVEQFFHGGSGVMTSEVAVRDGWTRVDTQYGSGGAVRHCLTDGDVTHIWYGTEETVFTGAAGGISADTEQATLSYEDILTWNAGDIAEADYRLYEDIDCIYVKTAEKNGCYTCYWVSISSGLLTAAEKYENEALVYRMKAAEPDDTLPEESLFELPNAEAELS